ncbi:MATE family efflux transporter [Flavobacterium sp.]|uniref:MATE family efflux transporter n=1 Tax=Flavobacterium sp. TaxID=239 RepID=UPI00261039CB|nr:MATE family efflux transporter [Flavobacterium sp.]
MSWQSYRKEFTYNIQLAYPVILGMVGHTLIGIVDNIMVGRLGSTELAAVSLGNSLIFVAMSLGIGFSTALTPLIAQADASSDTQQIRTYFQHGWILCTLLGWILFGLVVLSLPLLKLLGQPEEVLVLAEPFLIQVAFSLVPLIMYQAYKQFADGLSLTKYSMYAILLANVVHIVLNYIFIYGWWIIPKMGIQGAALGTVLSRIAMLVFMHVLLYRQPQLCVYFSKFHWKNLQLRVAKQIVNLGIPSALQMLFEVVLFTAAIWLCGTIGKTSQAANQIALSLASLTFMFAMGLSVVSMIRVGNFKGMQDYRGLVRVARSVFLLTVLVEIVFALFFIVFHAYLPQLFLDVDNTVELSNTMEVLTIASNLLIVAAFFQTSDGIQVVVLGALRGLQDVKIPMYITFIAYWIIGFPLSFYLGKYTPLGAVGVWIGLLAGLTFAAFFLYIRFHYLTKKLIQNTVN